MSGEADGPEGRLRRFATIWSRAIFPVTATSLTRVEFEQELMPLARRLRDALGERNLDAPAAQAVGAALIGVHCTDPEALTRTLDVVDAYLVLYCRPDEDRREEELRARCARLQHSVAAG
ncbi:GGDEF domain-containing protein, partial [Streptomyces sp. A475]